MWPGENIRAGKTAYWKNGRKVELSAVRSNANAIAVSGKDVYVAGREFAAGFPHVLTTIGCYWKNGELITLSGGRTGASVPAIAVVGR